MKIGIITQPLHNNYGGLLQNYALQQVLIFLGHEPMTLDQTCTIPMWKFYAWYCKVFLLKLIGKGANRRYPFMVSKKEKKIIGQCINRFVEKYIAHTEPFEKSEEFREYTIKHQLEVLLVGSDQVWRPIYNQNILCSFFDFAEGLPIKRLAYAASFGVDCWEFTDFQTKRSQELIRDFSAVSVREFSGVDLCKRYLCCDASHVLDPTMLLDKEDYVRLIEDEDEPVSKGNLFTYILDESDGKQEIINEVASMLGLLPFTAMPEFPINRRTIKRNLDKCIYPSVTRWLRSFMDAKFVVCDSFHGAVFSIIFNKPFVIIANKERGLARFSSLLHTFGLYDRIVSSMDNLHTIIKTPIDWKRVNCIRAEMKVHSIGFLRSNLK